ncbi:MAG: sigma-70 family RNA polymerase sigma factor [Planctomycetota bacterium]|nr:sigma-70 family RNA polymerase sigma factor [Planctomycetota bacterium]
MQDIFSHQALDRRLDPAAKVPGRFEKLTDRLIEELDRSGQDLEITDPLAWRRPATPREGRRVSPLQQFRLDVDGMFHLDRQDEARLARRIEFARCRLERARERADLERVPSESAVPSADEPLPRDVARRALELHALRTEMVERNLYLVLINVERYAHTGGNRADLIQEGSLSLFRAVDGFDWRRGLLFRTYAVHWLNQAFRNYLYNHTSTVRVPVYLQKALKHINQATIRLGDPSATSAQIAAASDLKENLVSSALRAARTAYSIDAGFTDDRGSRLRDLLVVEVDEDGPYHTRLEDLSLEEGLERAMARLSDRERLVVRMRFGVGYVRPHTLAQVAAELGVSVERVRQIQVRAIAKMNTPGLRRDLDPFLN